MVSVLPSGLIEPLSGFNYCAVLFGKIMYSQYLVLSRRIEPCNVQALIYRYSWSLHVVESLLSRIKGRGGEGLGARSQTPKKMRHCNMLTCPQNAENPISKDFNVNNIPGEGCPRIPQQGNVHDIPYLEPPSLKSCMRPSSSWVIRLNDIEK